MPKLLIWDLDETLWTGTLAEGEELAPREQFFEAIRQLNTQGLVNAIVSKNDYHEAKERLIQFGYWDLFVFPRISFDPKGSMVTQLLEDMALRADDTVFIDDNHLNRREVQFSNPNIDVKDPNDLGFVEWLESLVQETAGVKKDRVAQYRVLEEKLRDRELAGSSNEDFLRTCDIRIAVVQNAKNINFEARLEELVNRTNQLNYTKSRMALGSMSKYITDVSDHLTYSLFVWDKYGYYGLVGFAGVAYRGDSLEHFLFSCRTMNMGVENALAAFISSDLPNKHIDFPVDDTMPDWITVVSPSSIEFQEIYKKELKLGDSPSARLRIMANCQSGPIAHYAGISPVDTDAWPDIFSLQSFVAGEVSETFPPITVYGAFQDYDPRYWKGGKLPEPKEYETYVRRLLTKTLQDRASLMVILPPDSFKDVDPSTDRTPERFQSFNHVWESFETSEYDALKASLGTPDSPQHLKLLKLGQGREVDDPRHFDRTDLMYLGDQVRTFFELDDPTHTDYIPVGARKERKASHLRQVEGESRRAFIKGGHNRMEVWSPTASEDEAGLALTWEIELVGYAQGVIPKSCVVYIQVDKPEAVRDRVDGVIWAKDQGMFFRYFCDNDGDYSTRFVITGNAPFSIRGINTQGHVNFDNDSESVLVDRVSVWRHK